MEVKLWQSELVYSVDHDLRLKADYSPRLGRWTVVQQSNL
jgi:hypothetical protein